MYRHQPTRAAPPAQRQAARLLRRAVRRPWTEPVQQVLAWPTGRGGAARAARKRPQQAQRHWRGFGVDGNWMKTLGVLSPPGGACSSGVAKITPAFAATPEILAQASAG